MPEAADYVAPRAHASLDGAVAARSRAVLVAGNPGADVVGMIQSQLGPLGYDTCAFTPFSAAAVTEAFAWVTSAPRRALIIEDVNNMTPDTQRLIAALSEAHPDEAVICIVNTGGHQSPPVAAFSSWARAELNLADYLAQWHTRESAGPVTAAISAPVRREAREIGA